MENHLIDLLKQNLDLNDFYSITIWKNDMDGHHINLQGNNTPELLLKYSNLGFEFKLTNGTWFKATKNKFIITLT